MKRVLLAIWITAVVAIAAVPATIAIGPGGLSFSQKTASASLIAAVGGGGTAPAGPGGTSSPDCVKLSIKINNNDTGEVCPDASGGGVIVAYLKLILKFLSGGVGIVVLLMMTIAGVQYITAAGQPEQVKAAKNRIQNAITALVLFLIAFAFLNFIIPGGIFG